VSKTQEIFLLRSGPRNAYFHRLRSGAILNKLPRATPVAHTKGLSTVLVGTQAWGGFAPKDACVSRGDSNIEQWVVPGRFL